jgi:hypothetical protein
MIDNPSPLYLCVVDELTLPSPGHSVNPGQGKFCPDGYPQTIHRLSTGTDYYVRGQQSLPVLCRDM